MKKVCIFICIILLFQLCCGCVNQSEELKKPVSFYYCRREISYNSSDAVLQPEIREGYSYLNNVIAFMQAYLRGPNSNDFVKIIPADVYLVSCNIEESTANIMFSRQFSVLSGIELTTACTAVLLTLHEFSGVDQIHIQAKDAQIEDNEMITFTLDDIILVDTVKTQDYVGE